MDSMFTNPIEERPVIAICYDFDKTLSPDDMQAQGFIQSVGYDVKAFWDKSNNFAKKYGMDQNLAWMYEMKKTAEDHTAFTREALQRYGKTIELFPGVNEWFSRIREYGESIGIKVEHYIISSGLKEIIEGTPIADEFTRIFASSFYYDENNVGKWPAQVVNYTSKTQFLFRIEKGILDVNDDRVNDHLPPDKIRIPFRNMVYIGDSETDVPCMRLVNSFGGYSIGVFNPKTGNKDRVYKMMTDERIKYFVPADYNDGSEIDELMKNIINRTAANEVLVRKGFSCLHEVNESDASKKELTIQKNNLITKLEDSRSYAQTHFVIGQMEEISEWNEDEVRRAAIAAVVNSQVWYILNDTDVKKFFSRIIKDFHSEEIDEVRTEISAEG